MLESIYIFSAIIGGGFVVASSLMGGGDSDVDSPEAEDVFGSDAGKDFSKPDLGKDSVASSSTSTELDFDSRYAGRFRPWASFKFWTFFLAFFGVTGYTLTLVGVSQMVTLGLALGMGFAFGLGTAWTLHRLSFSQTGSQLRAETLMGRIAEVTVAVRGQTPGSVRLLDGQRSVELLAVSDSDVRLEPGTKVLVVEVGDKRLKVIPYL